MTLLAPELEVLKKHRDTLRDAVEIEHEQKTGIFLSDLRRLVMVCELEAIIERNEREGA